MSLIILYKIQNIKYKTKILNLTEYINLNFKGTHLDIHHYKTEYVATTNI